MTLKRHEKSRWQKCWLVLGKVFSQLKILVLNRRAARNFFEFYIEPTIDKDMDGFYFPSTIGAPKLKFTADGRILFNMGSIAFECDPNELIGRDVGYGQICITFKGSYTVPGSQLTYVYEDVDVKIGPSYLTEAVEKQIKSSELLHEIESASIVLLGNTLSLTND